MTTPFQTESLLVNGVELHYLEQGQGNPVIFIHGGVTDLRTWGLQMEPFSHYYRTVAYSLRYHYPNAWAGDGSNGSLRDLSVIQVNHSSNDML